MAKGPWFDAIINGLGHTSDGFTIAETPKIGPNGEKLFSLEFVDPIRDGHFFVDLPADATDQKITTLVRKEWRRFIRSHPITRGVRN